MKLIILFATLFFLFLAFLGNTEIPIDNPFLSYLYLIFKNIITYFPYYLILFCVLFLFLIRPYLKRRHLTLKIIGHTIFQIFTIGFLGIFISFIILLLIAFLELNVFSVILNQNPTTLGVKTDTNEIARSIEENNTPPMIITIDENSENEVVAIAKATSGTNNFFGNKILSSVPNLFIIPVGDDSKLLFLDNTLVVKEINEKDMETISPIVGFQIINNYFPARNIKPNPKISVMNSDTYKLFRKNDAKDKLSKVDVEITKTENAISDLTEAIEDDNEFIEENKTNQKEILTERDREYNACLSEGKYVEKVFVPENSEEDCREIIERWEEAFELESKEGKDLAKGLEGKQKRLEEYRFFDTYFKAQKKLMDISSDNIPSEMGLFEPNNSIRIIVNNTSGTKIADYFNTLSHEYLHFTSYSPSKRLESSFFEEALTEYFARQALRSAIQTDTNVGYPVMVKIIEEISKKISDPDLEEIYFNKDQAALENKMNLVYGDNFYDDNIVLFESLLYTSDPDQLLQIVNRIMRNLGGTPLRKEDIFSRESNI